MEPLSTTSEQRYSQPNDADSTKILVQVYTLCRVVSEADEKLDGSGTELQASASEITEKQGVFIVFTDGEVALDGFYQNGARNESFGEHGRVLASSSHRGKLVVASAPSNESCVIAMYCLEVSSHHTSGKPCIWCQARMYLTILQMYLNSHSRTDNWWYIDWSALPSYATGNSCTITTARLWRC